MLKLKKQDSRNTISWIHGILRDFQKMASDTLVFVLALLDDASLLALTVYFFITLSDLECDYLNATSCCDKLNKWIYPEIVAHSLLSLSLILSGHWILFCLYSSMTAWVIYKFVSKPSGNIGLYDPAEIHNRQQLKVYMKECLIKLVFHLVFFFVFLYNVVLSLLTGNAWCIEWVQTAAAVGILIFSSVQHPMSTIHSIHTEFKYQLPAVIRPTQPTEFGLYQQKSIKIPNKIHFLIHISPILSFGLI